MPRVKVFIPTKVEEILELARLIFAKHVADGASSILHSLQVYSWTLIGPTVPQCLAKHQEWLALRSQANEAYELRKVMLPPIRKGVRATSKFLLGVYRATPTRLGDWGFVVVMGSGRPKVEIPQNVQQLLELARLIYAKHQADGATSVLNGLQNVSWTTLGPTVQPCLDKHLEAEATAAQREEAYEARELLLPDILSAERATRDLLLGAFAGTPRRLGEWGFQVSNASSGPKPPPTA
jgi:hypothetical protein